MHCTFFNDTCKFHIIRSDFKKFRLFRFWVITKKKKSKYKLDRKSFKVPYVKISSSNKKMAQINYSLVSKSPNFVLFKVYLCQLVVGLYGKHKTDDTTNFCVVCYGNRTANHCFLFLQNEQQTKTKFSTRKSIKYDIL